jgi:hypothetical protein
MGVEAIAMRVSRFEFLVSSWLVIGAFSAAYGFDQEEKETIRRNFPAATRLEVDNVLGNIRVTGYNGSEIQMVAEKTIHAESQERLDAAKREVKLDTTQSGDTLTLYVDGPFRCHCNDGRSSIHEHSHPGYRVIYDFEIKVPAATVLLLGTVNGGEVRVDNTTGDFDVGNINGGIEMNEVAGSGPVHTVNGKISVMFSRNPTRDSSFKTINGAIEVSFRPNLSADVRVKTFNGHAYTDFDATALPGLSPVSERRDGKFIYRSDRSTGMRIGNGGPEFKFDTLNGSIRIINRGQ